MNRGRCLAASAVLVALAVVACAAAPQVYVTEIRYNFGLAIEGNDVTHTFLFRNVGDQPLSVLDVITECGCTAADSPTTTIEPGATGELAVTFHTAGYGGSTVLRYIWIQTDDPALPTATFELVGSVMSREAVLLDPSELESRLLLVFDLRDWDSYVAGHLLGAVHLPADRASEWLQSLPTDTPILLYDQDGSSSGMLAARLITAGHTAARSLAGGLDEWIRQFGGASVTTALPLAVEPGVAP
jgi:rhodanese-related sulfurtransferase